MGVAEVVRNPRSYTLERARMARLLLFSPGRFYEEYIGSRGIRREVFLVGFVGVLGAAGAFYLVETIREPFATNTFTGSQLGRGVQFQLWGVVVDPVVNTFFFWGAFAVLLYLASWIYSEEGGIFPLFKKTAWAMAPMAFANLLLSIAYVYVALTVEVNTDFAVAGATTARRFNALWEPFASNVAVVGARAASVLFVVWFAYIAAHAVADVREIDVSKGYRVAAVPVVVYAAWTGYQLLQYV